MWGYRLVGHRPLSRERLRVLFWLLGAVLAAAFASCLPRSAHWPLPAGLGGVVGDALLRVPPAFFGVPLTGTRQLGAAIVLGVAALMAFAAAAGIIWRDSPDDDEDEPGEDEDESVWVSLGLLAHYLLSFQARLARIFRRRAPPRFPVSDAETPRRRLEPRMRDDPEHDAEDEDGEADEDKSTAPAPRAPRRPRAAAKPARRSWGGYELLRSAFWRRRAPASAPRSAPTSSARTGRRSKACSPTSACAGRSSMRGRGRW